MSRIKYILLLLAFMVNISFANIAHSQNNQSKAELNKQIETQKKKIQNIEADIKFLDKQIEATNKKHSNTVQGLVLLRKKIQGRNQIIRELDAQIKQQNDEIYLKNVQINQLQRNLDTLQIRHKRLILGAYKNRDLRTWFMYILASGSMEQGYRRYAFLKDMSQQINKQGDKIIETQNIITQEKAKLELLMQDNKKSLLSRQDEMNQLTTEEKASNKYAQSLSKQQAQLKKELANKRAESQRLNREVERMITAAIKASQASSSKTASADKAKPVKGLDEIDVKLSNVFGENKGKLPWPVSEGVIIEQFGEHPHPTLKNVMLPFNNGVNISTRAGAEVKSVFEGVVKQVIIIPGYNQCVLIQHGKYFTFYCKLRQAGVKAGDKVSRGSVLGTLEVKDNTSVLHFELWNGTTKQNPEYWLKK